MISELARTARMSAEEMAGTVAGATESARELLHERGEAALHAGADAAHHAGDAAAEWVHALGAALGPVADRAGEVAHDVPRRGRRRWVLLLLVVGVVAVVVIRRRARSEAPSQPAPAVPNPHAGSGNNSSSSSPSSSAAVGGMVGDPQASS